MSKNNSKRGAAKKVLGGALIGGALGVVAGMLLAPKSGDKLRKDVKDSAADFYKYLVPRLKKLKDVGEKEYEQFIDTAVAAYGKARKLTHREMQGLKHNSRTFWKNFKKHL